MYSLECSVLITQHYKTHTIKGEYSTKLNTLVEYYYKNYIVHLFNFHIMRILKSINKSDLTQLAE